MKQILSRIFCVLIVAAPMVVWGQTVPEAMVGLWFWEKTDREGGQSVTFVVNADGTFQLSTFGYYIGGAHGNGTESKGTMTVSSNQITLTVTHYAETTPTQGAWQILNRREREEQKSTIRYRLSGNTLTLGNRPYKRQ